MGIDVSSIIGLLILTAGIWAVANVFRSAAATGAKMGWIVAILILPVIGVTSWLISGPRGSGAI